MRQRQNSDERSERNCAQADNPLDKLPTQSKKIHFLFEIILTHWLRTRYVEIQVKQTYISKTLLFIVDVQPSKTRLDHLRDEKYYCFLSIPAPCKQIICSNLEKQSSIICTSIYNNYFLVIVVKKNATVCC